MVGTHPPTHDIFHYLIFQKSETPECKKQNLGKNILQKLFLAKFFRKKSEKIEKSEKSLFLPNLPNFFSKMIFSLISRTVNPRNLGNISKSPQKILQKPFLAQLFRKKSEKIEKSKKLTFLAQNRTKKHEKKIFFSKKMAPSHE